MSLSIWTQCEGKLNARKLELDAWRVVESQYITSTRKLVDSDAEQNRLESLIDGAKPPVPKGLDGGLHFLLFTPFRHPPLRNGSRLGVRRERGIFYGSKAIRTALAEVAYYRLVFLTGTTADLGIVQTQHTAFRVSVKTVLGIDLTADPFREYEALISSPTDYQYSQQLGTEMRKAGIEVVLFKSARDSQGGANVALIAPAFGKPAPYPDTQEWLCTSTHALVEMTRKNAFTKDAALGFPRAQFLVDGALPRPAV